jgi:UDP-N-acetylmuramate dehydrogenase
MGGDIRFSELTTLQVGGTVERLVTATTQRDLVDLAREAWATDAPWLALGGGSNLLVGDEGFEGTVIRVATRGIEVLPDAGSEASVRIRVQAGESWDDLVAWTVEHGYSGIEALSGIPGSVGAAPVQNIGAYGQELEATLVAIDFLDEAADTPRRMAAEELELAYRTSVLKQGLRGIVVSVELELHDTAAERAVLGEALGQPVERAVGRPGADRPRARQRARPARREGHGARSRRRRLGERGLVLHEPDRHRAHRAHAPFAGATLVPRARRARPGHAARRVPSRS